jgi:hypothetical protein
VHRPRLLLTNQLTVTVIYGASNHIMAILELILALRSEPVDTVEALYGGTDRQQRKR